MDGATKPDIAAEIAAALEWWRSAGVDADFADEPRDWLAPEESPAKAEEPLLQAPKPAPEPASPRAQIGGTKESWPQELAAFQSWWMTEPSLDNGTVARRVPPRGPSGAELMILVPDPEEDDREVLLSGRHGRLLGGLIAALGLSEDQIYFASALPRATPMPDWGQLADDGLGMVVKHHVALAAPKRLLVLSRGVSSLLGHDPANNSTNLPLINHERPTVPVLAAMDLAALLARPRAKAGLWRQLLDWTGTPST